MPKNYQRYKVEWNRVLSEKIRSEMIEAYGGKCSSCGENDPIVLQLDHIYNDASKDREWFIGSRRAGMPLYKVLRGIGWPKGDYQLLCCNCNAKKEHYRRIATRVDTSSLEGNGYQPKLK